MKSITIKKMVPKFDTDAISSNLPYRINMGGNTYVGVFYIITEDCLEFKFFDEDGTIKFGRILPHSMILRYLHTVLWMIDQMR